MARFVVATLVSAGLAGAACAPAVEVPACVGDEEPGTVSVFAEGLGATEGIAFSPDGRLFVSRWRDVAELKADGTFEVRAELPRTVGLAWWDDALFVASGDDGTGGSGDFCAETRRGAVYRMTAEGQVTLFANGIRAPNFLAVTPWDTLLVSDDCGTNLRIYEVSKTGMVSGFHDGVPSANGLAFDAPGTTLFAVSTFTDPAPLWAVPVTGSTAGEERKLHDFPGGASPDGITLDAEGRVYVALNTGLRIERWLPGTQDVEPFAVAVDTPASLAFGVGEGFDACSIYATSLFGEDVHRIRVGTPGLALRH